MFSPLTYCWLWHPQVWVPWKSQNVLLCISEYFLDVLAGHQLLSPVISCATIKIIALKYKPQTFSMGD